MNSELNNKILSIIKKYSDDEKYNYLVDIIREKLKEKPNLSDKQIESIIKKEIDNNIELEEDLKKEELTEDDDEDIDNIIRNSEKLYLHEIRKIPLLTPEEEISLFTEYSKNHSEEIRKKIITANLRLVVAIAKRYNNSEVGLLDLVQVGNLGLMKAIDKFDVSKGYKLSTYAGWWIRQEILTEIHKHGSTVYIPYGKLNLIKKIETIENAYIKENGRKPTPTELCNEVGITIEKYKEVLSISRGVVSLSTPITEGEETELGDFIEDENIINPEENGINQSLTEEITSYLNRLLDQNILKERDIDVIKKRFGLENKRVMTLNELGAIYKVQKE